MAQVVRGASCSRGRFYFIDVLKHSRATHKEVSVDSGWAETVWHLKPLHLLCCNWLLEYQWSVVVSYIYLQLLQTTYGRGRVGGIMVSFLRHLVFSC